MNQAHARKTTYLLEMSRREELRPPQRATVEFEVKKVEIPCPEFNWFFHQAVGAEFRWGGRNNWQRRDWCAYVGRDELETWVAYVAGTPAGYYELNKLDDGSVRIECFGLLSQFCGQGLGGALLAHAVERGWETGANRVWLSTCSHDHPHALQNYLARGFKLVEETKGPPNLPWESAIFRPGKSPH